MAATRAVAALCVLLLAGAAIADEEAATIDEEGDVEPDPVAWTMRWEYADLLGPNVRHVRSSLCSFLACLQASPPPSFPCCLRGAVHRSQVYFGTKTRSEEPVIVGATHPPPPPTPPLLRAMSWPRPQALSRVGGRACCQTGLAWFAGDDISKLRHACQDSDGLERWGWQRHDGRCVPLGRVDGGQRGFPVSPLLPPHPNPPPPLPTCSSYGQQDLRDPHHGVVRRHPTLAPLAALSRHPPRGFPVTRSRPSLHIRVRSRPRAGHFH
jgi:hypothetical protein